MPHFITIAGPQSAGKTTTMEYLKKRHKDWQFLDEINPRTVTANKNLGAAQTSAELERLVLKTDIDLISRLTPNVNTFVECGISHYTYSLHFLDKSEADDYFKKYVEAYKKKHKSPIVVFIDTKPKFSWRRRREKYLKRILDMEVRDKKEIKKRMDEYKKTVYKLYPSWLTCYKKIPFPKIIVRNSYKSEKKILEEIEELIKNLLK